MTNTNTTVAEPPNQPPISATPRLPPQPTRAASRYLRCTRGFSTKPVEKLWVSFWICATTTERRAFRHEEAPTLGSLSNTRV